MRILPDAALPDFPDPGFFEEHLALVLGIAAAVAAITAVVIVLLVKKNKKKGGK